MSKKEKGYGSTIRVPREEENPSWIPVIFMFCVFWPIGAFLLLRKLNVAWKNAEIRNFRNYAVVIGERPYVQLSELVRTLGKPEATVRADLQKMIDRGYMGNRAYIDRSTGCIVIDPERRTNSERTERNADRGSFYTAADDGAEEVRARKAKKEEPAQPEPAKETIKKEEKAAPQEDEFEKILRQIRELNDRIDDEPVSKKIDRIGEITANIFMFVKQKPERRDEVHKFMSYYLPTTMKLLESYSLLEKQSYQGENIVAARRDIENILDQMIPAFEKQLDRLFQADAIDISADIDVLETMMAKDGLSDKGLTMKMGGK